MAKSAKKAKKVSKSPWDKRPIQALNFLNVERLQKGGEHLKISRSGIYLSSTNVAQLEVKKGDFILIARGHLLKGDDETIYIAKKPKGLFGGYKLTTSSKANPSRLWTHFKADRFNLPLGLYDLGKPIRTFLLDHNDKEVRFEAYVLTPV